MYTGPLSSLHTNSSFKSQKLNTTISSNSLLEGLQKQVNLCTKKLEVEKRRLLAVTQIHDETLKEYQHYKENLNSTKKIELSSSTQQINSKCRSLELAIKKAITAYDQSLAENAQLKVQIDELRRKKRHLKTVEKTLIQNIDQLSKKLEETQKQAELSKRKTEEIKAEIRSTHENNVIQNKSTIVKAQKIGEDYLLEKRNIQLSMSNKPPRAQSIDTAALLKFKLKRSIAKNKETLKNIEIYQKQLMQIDEALNQIKQGTGMTDLQDVANTFIKAHEQNVSLCTYADELSIKNDELQQAVKMLENKIQERTRENMQTKERMKVPTPEQLKSMSLKNQIEENKKICGRFQNTLSQIGPILLNTLVELSKMDFAQHIPSINPEELNITHRSIESILSHFEVYLNQIYEETTLKNNNNFEQSVQKRKEHVGAKKTVYLNNLHDENVKEVKEDLMDENDLQNYAQEYIKKAKPAAKGGKPAEKNVQND